MYAVFQRNHQKTRVEKCESWVIDDVLWKKRGIGYTRRAASKRKWNCCRKYLRQPVRGSCEVNL